VKQHRSKSSAGILSLVLGLATVPVHAVPLATDLAQAAATVVRDCKPLALEFATPACSYCRLLETEVLNPTLRNSSYDTRVLMLKVMMGTTGTLRDFDGDRISGDQLAQRYRIDLTRTLIFVDAKGTELTERMVGVTTLDFYGGYLDEALDKARGRLLAQQHCHPPAK